MPPTRRMTITNKNVVPVAICVVSVIFDNREKKGVCIFSNFISAIIENCVIHDNHVGSHSLSDPAIDRRTYLNPQELEAG